MGSYSKDLRLKVLGAVDRGVDRGVPRKEVAEVFGVSLEAARTRGRKGGRKPVMDEKKLALTPKMLRIGRYQSRRCARPWGCHARRFTAPLNSGGPQSSA